MTEATPDLILYNGTLHTPGKLADLVVADQNIFEIAPDTIAETRICLTLFDGKIVYEH